METVSRYAKDGWAIAADPFTPIGRLAALTAETACVPFVRLGGCSLARGRRCLPLFPQAVAHRDSADARGDHFPSCHRPGPRSRIGWLACRERGSVIMSRPPLVSETWGTVSTRMLDARPLGRTRALPRCRRPHPTDRTHRSHKTEGRSSPASGDAGPHQAARRA